MDKIKGIEGAFVSMAMLGLMLLAQYLPGRLFPGPNPPPISFFIVPLISLTVFIALTVLAIIHGRRYTGNVIEPFFVGFVPWLLEPMIIAADIYFLAPPPFRLKFTVKAFVDTYLGHVNRVIVFGVLLGFIGASANIMRRDKETGRMMLFISLGIWSLIIMFIFLGYIIRLIRYGVPW